MRASFSGFLDRCQSGRLRKLDLQICLGLAIGLALTSCAFAQEGTSQPASSIRVAVAHQHAMSWCLGYLTFNGDTISYQVVQPQRDQKHSFQFRRSELLSVGRWTLFNQPRNAVELKFGKSVYHFWWLTNEQQVEAGRRYQFDPPDAGPADTLIGAINNPSGGLSIPAPAAPVQTASAVPSPQQTFGPANSEMSPPSAGVEHFNVRGVVGLHPISSEGAEESNTQPNLFPLDIPAPAADARLDGLYYGLHMGHLSIYSVAPDHVDHMFYIFSPDGWFMSYNPDETLLGFDLKAAIRAGKIDRNSYGRYKLNEDKTIHLTYQSGGERDILRNDDGPNPGMEKYVKLCRCDGMTLNGNFRAAGTTAFLSFTRDGQFVDRGAIHEIMEYAFVPEERMTGDSQIGEKLTQPGSGTYAISNYTIVFSYSDGRRIGTSFGALQGAADSPPWILLRGSSLERWPQN